MHELPRNKALIVGAALATLLFLTRYSYFELSVYCANASMAVFALGGVYLARHVWFAGLMAFAIAIDMLALAQGHVPAYLFTSAYVFEPIAYALLWYGARMVAARHASRLVLLVASAILAGIAFALTNGSFYWMSGLFPATSLAGWGANYMQWAPLFVGTTLGYSAAILLADELRERLGNARVAQPAH